MLSATNALRVFWSSASTAALRFIFALEARIRKHLPHSFHLWQFRREIRCEAVGRSLTQQRKAKMTRRVGEVVGEMRKGKAIRVAAASSRNGLIQKETPHSPLATPS